MKKLFFSALVAALATSAFAQNPDALKQIKKAKALSEAVALVESSKSSMSASENAQAYNKLVELALKTDDVKAAEESLHPVPGVEPKAFDKNALVKDVCTALNYALVCDGYDCQPDEKGKTPLKFRKKNAERIYALRRFFIEAGETAREAENMKEAVKYYGAYVMSGAGDLFEESVAAAEKKAKDNAKLMGEDVNTASADPYLNDVAKMAAWLAGQDKDFDSCKKYLDVVINGKDAKEAHEALLNKIYYMKQEPTTAADSLKLQSELAAISAKYASDSDIFLEYAQFATSIDKAKGLEILNARIQSNPSETIGYLLKANLEMVDGNYDAAITDATKGLETKVDDQKNAAFLNYIAGVSYQMKAGQAEKEADQRAMVTNAIKYLEGARQLDPENQMTNWGYALYNCYYFLYGEADGRTKELKEKFGY